MSHNRVYSILTHCHSLEIERHFSASRTTSKVLQCGFYWPTMFQGAKEFVNKCDQCLKTGNILRKDEMPLSNILEIELFDMWGIDS